LFDGGGGGEDDHNDRTLYWFDGYEHEILYPYPQASYQNDPTEYYRDNYNFT
jgi:hypothetical protein